MYQPVAVHKTDAYIYTKIELHKRETKRVGKSMNKAMLIKIFHDHLCMHL